MNKRPTLITQTISGIKSNYCLSFQIISKISRQISMSIMSPAINVHVLRFILKGQRETKKCILWLLHNIIKPPWNHLIRSFPVSSRYRCLSLHHLSPNFSIIQHSSRGSQAIYPLAVRAPVQVLSSWSCILRAKFPIQSQPPLEPAPALVAGGTAGCVWPQKVDDRERERDGVWWNTPGGREPWDRCL